MYHFYAVSFNYDGLA